jgi:hypothetical protein
MCAAHSPQYETGAEIPVLDAYRLSLEARSAFKKSSMDKSAGMVILGRLAH